MPQLRSWAARRGKEEVELYQARSMKELKKHSVIDSFISGRWQPGCRRWTRTQETSEGKGLVAHGVTLWRLNWQPMTQGALPNYASNLFPLPLPDALKMVRGLSRRSAQHLSRHVKIRDELRELVAALNWMHCGDFEAQPFWIIAPSTMKSCADLALWLRWRVVWATKIICLHRRQPFEGCSMVRTVMQSRPSPLL